MDVLRLFLHYSSITIKSRFQYKIDALFRSLAVFLRESSGIIIIYFMLLKFDDINGWNINELLFLFSFLFFTYGLLILFFTGFRDFEKMVNRGDLDRFLLRPRGLVFQIIASNADWFATIGHGCLGLLLFTYSATQINIDWNAALIAYCVVAIISGVLIQGALFLFIASLSFTLIRVTNIRNILYWNTRKFAGYPLSIFHGSLQFFLTYIVPFAFVNYFPAQFILRKEDLSDFPIIYIYIAPCVGFVLYALSYCYWRYSLRFYKSTGN